MKDKILQHSVILALLLYFFGQAVAGIGPLSLTYDEPIYTGVGYADLATGDVAWHEHVGHPPLVNLLTAWPLLLNPQRPDPRTFPQWGSSDMLGFSRDILPHLGTLEQVTFVTRLPIIWLCVLLAALVYRWAKATWSHPIAGILALLLFTLDPTIRAHGRLNSTDMGLAAFGFLSAYSLAQYLKYPSRQSALAVGLSVGLPLSAKASGPYFVGIAGLLLILWSSLTWRHQKRWFLRLVCTGLSWLALALFVLWAAYLFEMRPLQPGGFPVPAASHWKGLSYINAYMQEGQTTYFHGELYTDHHPWQYFLVGFLIKTPMPTLILFFVSLGSLIALRLSEAKNPGTDLFVLLSVPTGYFVLATLSALQIGQRHLLPMYPFLCVLCGRLAQPEIWHKLASHRTLQNTLQFAMVVLLVWLGLDMAHIHPYELSYFNALAGGTEHGHQILADSSVDWGQALKAARTYIQEQNLASPQLAAFSSLDPVYYGLTFEPLPPTLNAPLTLTAQFNPRPGTYIISAVPLHGLWVLDPDTYAWFRHHKADDIIAHALFVYHVPTPKIKSGWVAQCLPATLNQQQVDKGIGIEIPRKITFDCEQSWLYPQGQKGWYVLPGDGPPSPWVEKRLRTAQLTYTQREHWSHPALSLYLWEGDMSIDTWKTEQRADTNGPLTFMGYKLGEALTKANGGIELTTLWQVGEIPDRPLSLMAHLIGPDGTAAAVGDGLGFPIEQWQVGDFIMQRHTLTPPPDTAPGTYMIHIGAYWLDTMERWTFSHTSQKNTDIINLGPVNFTP